MSATMAPHFRILAVVAAVLAADAVLSIGVPFAQYVFGTEPFWEAANVDCAQDEPPCPPPIARAMVWQGILHEYRLDAWATWTGIYLLVPIGWMLDPPLWWPWQPFVWLGAFVAGGTVVHASRLPLAPRLLHGLLVTLAVSGFGAYHWSTLGD